MKEAVQSANIEGESLRSAAQNFIQMYQATPHTATGVSPHAAMHGGREMMKGGFLGKMGFPHLQEVTKI